MVAQVIHYVRHRKCLFAYGSSGKRLLDVNTVQICVKYLSKSCLFIR